MNKLFGTVLILTATIACNPASAADERDTLPDRCYAADWFGILKGTYCGSPALGDPEASNLPESRKAPQKHEPPPDHCPREGWDGHLVKE